MIMNVDRLKTKLIRQSSEEEREDVFMAGTPAERVAFMWELTLELWSLRYPDIAEQRLQRTVTKLIRQGS